ncbi:MAG: hypothetical protein ACNA8W_02620 [Bradymonadaceae bacterium]
MRSALIFGLLISSLVWSGCTDGELSDDERAEVMRIFHTGLELEKDPYVRAETLRILEILADPHLAELAEARVQDSAPVARVAALRVLMRTEHPQARQRSLAAFNSGSEREKLAILRAALDVGNEPLRRTLTERALRAPEPRVRALAFESGPLPRFEEALAAGNTDLLNRTLIPEIGKFIEDDDDYLASLALSKLIEAGETDRARPLLERFENEQETVERRVTAARALMRARVQEARPLFEAVLAASDDFDVEAIGVPKRRIDAAIIRASLLGATGLGNAELISPTQDLLKGADVAESIEVLEALAANPSSEAAVSLRIALRDARTNLRRPAIRLYADRKDAQADALFGAMRHDDIESQKMIAEILATRFADEWKIHLAQRLQNEQLVDATLTLLRDVIRSEEEFAVLAQLKEPLLEIAGGEERTRSALASYLLFRMPGGENLSGVMTRQGDLETWYAYMEYLITQESREHVPIFRENLYADLYGLRLMSAAGLWAVFPSKEPLAAAEAADEE